MIKEASRDTDLGETLKCSMNMQGLVFAFLFSTILARLQVGLDFPDDVAHPSAEPALKQWYVAVCAVHRLYIDTCMRLTI